MSTVNLKRRSTGVRLIYLFSYVGGRFYGHTALTHVCVFLLLRRTNGPTVSEVVSKVVNVKTRLQVKILLDIKNQKIIRGTGDSIVGRLVFVRASYYLSKHVT